MTIRCTFQSSRSPLERRDEAGEARNSCVSKCNTWRSRRKWPGIVAGTSDASAAWPRVTPARDARGRQGAGRVLAQTRICTTEGSLLSIGSVLQHSATALWHREPPPTHHVRCEMHRLSQDGRPVASHDVSAAVGVARLARRHRPLRQQRVGDADRRRRQSMVSRGVPGGPRMRKLAPNHAFPDEPNRRSADLALASQGWWLVADGARCLASHQQSAGLV